LYAIDCSDPFVIIHEIVGVELITNYDINETYLAGDNINAIAFSAGFDSTLKERLLTNDIFVLSPIEVLIEETPTSGSKFSLTLILTLKDHQKITAISNDVIII